MGMFRNVFNYLFLYLATHNKAFLHIVSICPRWASIKVTENCNSRCITCNAWKIVHTGELSTEELKSVLKQLKKAGVIGIEFTGGEPLLRQDIGVLLREANRIGFKHIAITTNGILLKGKAKELLENGITRINVSVDGLETTNNSIRGVPSYRRAIEGIKAIKALEDNYDYSILIGINTTLTKLNLEEVPDLIEICRNLNIGWNFNLLDTHLYFFEGVDVSNLEIDNKTLVDHIFGYLHKVKGNSNVISISHDHLEYAKNYLKGKNSKLPCVLAYSDVYIGPKGDVYSGCWVLPPIGNLREQRLKDILNSSEYKERAENMFLRRCSGCTCGYGGNVTAASGIRALVSRAAERRKSL